jgi:predicted Zn-ribbon and HTH transcriptional regulator
MRASDGPVDLGHYACGCGYQFAAPVETAVSCPHCGADQAW